MRSTLSICIVVVAAATLSACSGSEKAPAELPTATAEAAPAQPPAPTPVGQAPSFDTIPVDRPAQPRPPAPTGTPQPQPQPVGFRVPADAIGGEKMGESTFDIATRGEAALHKHFADTGVDSSNFYFKIPVEQRGNYWTMTFYGNPPTQPDGMYVEVRVFPDGSAEVMR